MGKKVIFSEWIKKERESKGAWAADYLGKKHLPKNLWPLATTVEGDPANQIEYFFEEVLPSQETEEYRNKLLKQMYDSWRQKNRRKKNKNSGNVELGFLITVAAKKKLKTLSKKHGMSQSELLELIVNDPGKFWSDMANYEISSLKHEVKELKQGEKVQRRGEKQTSNWLQVRSLESAITELRNAGEETKRLNEEVRQLLETVVAAEPLPQETGRHEPSHINEDRVATVESSEQEAGPHQLPSEMADVVVAVDSLQQDTGGHKLAPRLEEDIAYDAHAMEKRLKSECVEPLPMFEDAAGGLVRSPLAISGMKLSEPPSTEQLCMPEYSVEPISPAERPFVSKGMKRRAKAKKKRGLN